MKASRDIEFILDLPSNPYRTGIPNSIPILPAAAHQFFQILLERMAANSLRRSDSALGMLFRRMISRQGPQKAVTTFAHKLARLVYALLKGGKEYVAQEIENDERKKAQYKMNRMIKDAASLGLKIEFPGDETMNMIIKGKVERQLDSTSNKAANTKTATTDEPVLTEANRKSTDSDKPVVIATTAECAEPETRLETPAPAEGTAAATGEAPKAPKKRGRPPKTTAPTNSDNFADIKTGDNPKAAKKDAGRKSNT
jgi:hypothetical protein